MSTENYASDREFLYFLNSQMAVIFTNNLSEMINVAGKRA